MTQSIDGLGVLERVGLHAVGACATAACAAILYMLVMLPSNETQSENLRYRESLRTVVASKGDVNKTLGKLTDEKNEVTEQIRNVRTRLPLESDANKLLSELSTLAERHALKVLSVQPAQTVVGDLAAYQEVKCRVLASYGNVCEFIDGLNRLESLAWTTGTRISVDPTTQRLQPIELDIALLYAPEETDAGKISLHPQVTKKTP